MRRLAEVGEGDRVLLGESRLVLSEVEAEIEIGESPVWCGRAASGDARPPAERLKSLTCIAEAALLAREGCGLSHTLACLLNLSPRSGAVGRGEDHIRLAVTRLKEALRQEDICGIIENVRALLGRGRGLTPSGDDLVIGLLLTLNRLWRIGEGDAELQDLANRVATLAYGQTSTLSANLIECAASGFSDERLLRVLDAIFVGSPGETQAAEYLLDWGASSGLDALVGVTVALSTDRSAPVTHAVGGVE